MHEILVVSLKHGNKTVLTEKANIFICVWAYFLTAFAVWLRFFDHSWDVNSKEVIVSPQHSVSVT